MKANLPTKELEILKLWQELDLYNKIEQKFALASKGKGNTAKKFVLHDGPPYANGEIHVGHAYNKILKDIINKSHIIENCDAPYIAGWDCHGLPIEHNIEKKYGKAGAKLSTEEFIAACRDYAASQVKLQLEDFKRLGVLSNWQKPYITMDTTYEANVIRALAQIHINGYLVRGYKPVHWCTACQSALAEAEVEYKDKTSPAIDVRFRVVNLQNLIEKISAASPKKIDVAKNANVAIPIWTTTPWTLPANEAVALHPTLIYSLVHCTAAPNDEYLILLEDLAAACMQRYGCQDYSIVATFPGQTLEGLQLRHPFLDKDVPVVLGEHVTTDAGTGAVHTAPAHGLEDYQLGKQYKLPLQNPVMPNGKFASTTPLFAGLDIFAANERVIETLAAHNNLLHHATIQHSYPHCWRHKTPLIFRTTPQWFINMDIKGKFGDLRNLALETIETKINWLHPSGKERIKDMVINRPDWCISRQRLWGTPLPLFIHKESGDPHPKTTELMRSFADEIEAQNQTASKPVQAITLWKELDIKNFFEKNQHLFSDFDAAAQNQHAQSNYIKATDTLDVWFDSGVSHFCVLQQNKIWPTLNFPADLYIEGADQYRGWFQSSLLTALALCGKPPYRNVSSHGFTVDGEGRKMSKSLGNIISPQKTNQTYGADILRLWAASSYPYDEIAISDEIIKSTTDAYRKLRNTVRYMLGNLFDFDPKQHLVNTQDLLALDRFALYEALQLQEKIKAYNDANNFYLSCSKLQYHAAVDLSSFYFSIIKDRLYTMPPASLGRRSAQTVLYHLLQLYIHLLAPFLSFTAEEIWQNLRTLWPASNKEESVFLKESTSVMKDNDILLEPFTQDDWQQVKKIFAAVYKELEALRAAGKIGSNLDAEVKLYCAPALYNILAKFAPLNKNENAANENELHFILITSSAEIFQAESQPQNTVAAENVDGLWIKTDASSKPKCPRCWHHRSDIGVDSNHADVCGRCAKNLTAIDSGMEGETRKIG